MDDSTRQALDRLRQELGRRGVTLVTPEEDSQAEASHEASPMQAQAEVLARCEDEDEDEQGQIGSRPLPPRRWLRYGLLAIGLLALLPWLAPIFAAVGWWGLSNPIYTLYILLCHQLPERAPFLFGYQVAFCWRNAAIYTGLFGFGLLYALSTAPRMVGGGRRRRGSLVGRSPIARLLRRLPRAIPLWVYLLTLAPLALDGFSHMLGLRDGLFTNADPAFGSFLVGSQVFSLNWWLRISTGLLAAFGTVWFTFPRLDKYMVLVHATRELQLRTRQYVQRGRPRSWDSDPVHADLSPLVESGRPPSLTLSYSSSRPIPSAEIQEILRENSATFAKV